MEVDEFLYQGLPLRPDGAPVVGDITGDGKQEIVFVNLSRDLVVAYDRFGNLLPGWPVEVDPVQDRLLLADLTGDGVLEVVTQVKTRHSR